MKIAKWMLAPVVTALIAVAVVQPTENSSATAAVRATGWTGTWSTAYENSAGLFPAQTTTRQVVHTSIGGSRARLRLSNVFNDEPLTLSDFHLARRASGATIVPSTDRAVTFGGASSVTIPAGGEAVSDPIAFTVAAESDVAISFYSPERAEGVSSQQFAFSSQYMANGDVSGAETLSLTQQFTSYFIVSDLEVTNTAATGAVVALGASITEGHISTFNDNHRYTNFLATRLNASGRTVGVLNEGIAGNQLLGVGVGPSAIDRFDRDVLGRSGVRSVIFADNPINDLGSGREPTGAQLINGTRQLIGKAHGAGIAFYCATLTPFGGNAMWTASREAARDEYNAFVRGAGSGCDAVVDFDGATHDPADPTKMRTALDSGDGVHPNDAGMQAIADSIPLALFGTGAPTPAALTLTQAFNNVAVSADAHTSAADFDGGGASFSAEALAATGLVHGSTVKVNGVSLTWPTSAGTGQFDNAIATGQTVKVSGTGNTLALLMSAGYGAASGTGTIRYTDATTQSFTVTSPDWFVAGTPDAPATLVAAPAYQNRSGNVRYPSPAGVFGLSVALKSGKTVASVTLPTAGVAPVHAGTPSLHVFAIGVAKHS